MCLCLAFGMQILTVMWASFIFSAVAGALIVSSFHSIRLGGIVLALMPLIVGETKKKLSVDLNLR